MNKFNDFPHKPKEDKNNAGRKLLLLHENFSLQSILQLQSYKSMTLKHTENQVIFFFFFK